jgi:hypothetical protein
LYKKGAVFPRKWKRRWFELTELHLRYYKNGPPGTKGCEERGLIVLHGRLPTRADNTFNIHGFEIPGHNSGKKRVKEEARAQAVSLYAETEEEMLEWVEQLIFCSLHATTRTAFKTAQKCFGVMKQQFERKKWPPAVLAQVCPCITTRRVHNLVTQEALAAYMQQYNPEKASNVDAILEVYSGRHLDLRRELQAKYGAEPAWLVPGYGEVGLKGSIIERPELDANRLHLLVGIVTPLPVPWAGRLLLCRQESAVDWRERAQACGAHGLEQVS